jgi:hypothetical protein
MDSAEIQMENRIVSPGYRKGTVIDLEGKELTPPEDWTFLPAGDGPLTRNVKKMGPVWQVQVERGRRTINKGIWADRGAIEKARAELEQKRNSPGYAKKRQADLARRARKHEAYVKSFNAAVQSYLDFHPRYGAEAGELARLVTEHATPVGSGTVARTERISIGKRAEAAVIAWLRHQTTGYDTMKIARIKGRRREVRRHLAAGSLKLLERYRQGLDIDDCPLQKVLGHLKEVGGGERSEEKTQT